MYTYFSSGTLLISPDGHVLFTQPFWTVDFDAHRLHGSMLPAHIHVHVHVICVHGAYGLRPWHDLVKLTVTCKPVSSPWLSFIFPWLQYTVIETLKNSRYFGYNNLLRPLQLPADCYLSYSHWTVSNFSRCIALITPIVDAYRGSLPPTTSAVPLLSPAELYTAKGLKVTWMDIVGRWCTM